MASRFGTGKDTVARIWRDHNLKPWKADTFKGSNDPRFGEKLVDVVGLYLNPPERAVALNLDEKTQVQAIDRTQPSLKRARWRLHFTLTSSSRRNLIERWPNELTERRLRRGVSDHLAASTDRSHRVWAGHGDDDLEPFVWHQQAVEIIAKVRRGRAPLRLLAWMPVFSSMDSTTTFSGGFR